MSVRRMPVPEHTVIAPEVMSENLRKILQDFPEPGLAVRDDATQHFALRWAGRTRAPFLCFCLEGRFELPAAGEQHPPFALKVGPGTGFLFSADTFVNSREQEIVKYLRITFDRDGTLFGITRRTVALQCDLGEGDLAIDACYVTSPRSTLADALLARLLEIPRADSALKAGSPVRELLRLLFHELSRHLLLRGESLHSGGRQGIGRFGGISKRTVTCLLTGKPPPGLLAFRRRPSAVTLPNTAQAHSSALCWSCAWNAPGRFCMIHD